MHLEFTHVFQTEARSISSFLGWGDVSIFSRISKIVLMLNKNTSALAASILRFVFSDINRGSHDATFDLTRVGVCTYVMPAQNNRTFVCTRTKPLTSPRAGELAAGILVGNLVVFPRFLSTCSSKFACHFSTYLSGKSSNLQHDDANPSTISWPGTRNGQPSAPHWLDQHGASEILGESVKLQDRGCQVAAISSNSRGKISNTTFTSNREVYLEGSQT